MSSSKRYQSIPTRMSESEFNEFVLPHLTKGSRGPCKKLSFYRIFHYILKLLHTGCQWEELPIEKDERGFPEIHYSNIFRIFQRWISDGCFKRIFVESIGRLFEANLLDTRVIHGDGTTTAAKKGGDNLGYNGHKHMKGDKVVAFCDRNCNIVGPLIFAAGNRNESPLLREAMKPLITIAKTIGFKIKGSIMSLDGIYNCRPNRVKIFNAGMVPNINPNKRNRKETQRGRKPFFDRNIFQERFRTIERVFAWEDKFKRLLIRFERKGENHYGMKFIAFALINLRHFCT